MKQPLKRAVSEHLEGLRLSDDQVQQLVKLAGHPPPAPAAHGRRLIGGVAVVATLLALLLFLPADQPGDRLQGVAEEVARNHLQLKPLEVRADTLAQVRPYFTELDFALRETRYAAAQEQALLGGRYCSIQGTTAAQLRIRNRAGKDHTLYQVPYDRARHGHIPNFDAGETPRVRYARGIGVTLWVEKGLLFALTGETP